MTQQDQQKVQILIDALQSIDAYDDVADPPFKPQQFGDIARKALSAYTAEPPAPAQGEIVRTFNEDGTIISGTVTGASDEGFDVKWFDMDDEISYNFSDVNISNDFIYHHFQIPLYKIYQTGFTEGRKQQGQEYPSAHGHAPLSNVQNTPERVVVGYGASVGRPGARAIYRAQRRQHEEWFDKVLAQEDGLLKEVINAAGKAKSQTAPTIGVSWVREEIEKRISYLKKTDAEVCKERWDMTQPEFKRRVARDTSNFLIERRHELEDLLKLIPSNESPFPTRERAIEWANGSYPGDDMFAVGARDYMTEMYDWIVQQINQK
jgi:hypothetical protein